MLNANRFLKAKNIYIGEFIRVLNLMIDCYFKIKKNEVIEPCQLETFLRNVLVKKYLRVYKKDFEIGYLSFDIESGEIDINCRTIGFIDIKISNIGYKSLLDEDEYYAFECKRLDGNSSLNGEYVNEGICRFIDGKYSSKMSLSGMIGFVQKGDIHNIVKDINKKITSNTNINSIALLEKYPVSEDFDCSYYSCHNRSSLKRPIDIYHLMFDYTFVS